MFVNISFWNGPFRLVSHQKNLVLISIQMEILGFCTLPHKIPPYRPEEMNSDLYLTTCLLGQAPQKYP